MYEKSENELLEQSERIKTKLEQLRKSDKYLKQFGSEKHKYKLNKVLTENEIINFEEQYKVKLALEYRTFLKHIGNGGAGPYYGVERLFDSLYRDLHYKNENEKVNLSEPFPHTMDWNLDFDEFSSNEEYENVYFSKEHSNGVLRLCNFGCGVFISLVVNGKEYGNMWFDDRCNDQGIYSAPGLKENERITFLDWYEEWLDKSLAKEKDKNYEKFISFGISRKRFGRIARILRRYFGMRRRQKFRAMD